MGFNLGVDFAQIFSAPHRRNCMSDAKNARIVRTFSFTYQIWWGSGFAPLPSGGGKQVQCFCLSVTLLNDRVCANDLAVKAF